MDDRFSVYSVGDLVQNAQPIQPATYGLWEAQGCRSDVYSNRALNSDSYTGPDTSVEKCASYCAGYTYFGLECKFLSWQLYTV